MPPANAAEQRLFMDGYHFAEFFVQDAPIAREVTARAWEYSRQAARGTRRQPSYWRTRPGVHITKLPLSWDAVFQDALCTLLDFWEQTQLAWPPARPSATDLLRWYVKFLFWQTMSYRPSYRALALGCLLYSYTPTAVAECTTNAWPSDNFRGLKARLLARTKARFPALLTYRDVHAHGGEKIQGRLPRPEEADLITDTLRTLTWWTPAARQLCNAIRAVPPRELFLFTEHPTLELYRRQQHFLACPVCAAPARDGIAWLVRDYNQRRAGQPQPLPDPPTALVIPAFIAGHP